MTGPSLPIQPFRGRILESLAKAGALILTAPTGSGKSTQTPQFLLGQVPGKILVLEPRRLAARSLAGRVADETKTALGKEIGYQVRFDSRCGPDTKVIFQTYGVFIQQMLKDPELPGVGAVLLDEFHERTLECDLALAWLKTLRKKIIVMSATLDAGPLEHYLPGAARLDVPGRLFPVDIRHLPGQTALTALQSLYREGLDGSVLIFMPGLREIRRTLELLGPFCRQEGLILQSLHGSMELAEQQQVLEPAQTPNRVIVATNVAETGLTIPQITVVIDSGLHRVAAYSPARDLNTLYLSRISLGNAAQRAGRAGRTAPGRCARLWSKADELGMASGLSPEITRLELSSLILQASSLPKPVEWLTMPPAEALAAARRTLAALGAAGAAGRALLRYPLPPKLAAVLEGAAALDPAAYERACAMAAVLESEMSGDLEALSREELSWEAAEICRQLKKLARPHKSQDGRLIDVWLRVFADRLAAREGAGAFYRLSDGRGVLLEREKDPPPLLLALDIQERAGGGQARQVSVGLFLRCGVPDVQAAFPGECSWKQVSEFDERQKRAVKEDRLIFRGLVLERREITEKKANHADLWAEKYVSGELKHPGRDEKVEQLLVRVALARRLYPDMSFPEMGQDDWRLIYGEVCAGKNSQKDIERVALGPHLAAYLGRPLVDFLDRVLPSSRRLPSGKSGRFTYHESRPAELAARLGDFLKMSGTLKLCEGRLAVVFDILAPNYRTVQKTDDLSSFWANTYPAVKKELQRRYPRHPWP